MTTENPYFLTDPLLEESLDFLNEPSFKCIQKEAADIQRRLHRAGWTHEAMEAAHHVLETIKVEALKSLTLNKEIFPVISSVKGIPEDLLSDMRLIQFGGRTFGEIYELALDYYKTHNEGMLITLQPPINADLLRFSTDNIPQFFINEVVNIGFGEVTVREIYGIAYFSNLWMLNKPGLIPFTTLYWHKSLTLLAELFNCDKRLATSLLCCSFLDLLEQPQDLATKELDHSIQLANDRGKLILKENHSRSKGGKQKKPQCNNFAVNYYQTNKSLYKNPTKAAKAIFSILKEKKYFGETPFLNEASAVRTIRKWIKNQKSDLKDAQKIIIEGIKKIRS